MSFARVGIARFREDENQLYIFDSAGRAKKASRYMTLGGVPFHFRAWTGECGARAVCRRQHAGKR